MNREHTPSAVRLYDPERDVQLTATVAALREDPATRDLIEAMATWGQNAGRAKAEHVTARDLTDEDVAAGLLTALDAADAKTLQDAYSAVVDAANEWSHTGKYRTAAAVTRALRADREHEHNWGPHMAL